MSSPLSDALRNAVNEQNEKLEKKAKNRTEIALEKTEQRVAQKIKELIATEGMDFYYNGYEPKMYVRTNNLRNSGAVSPCIQEFRSGSTTGFRYGAEFDETLMDHSVYELHIVHKHKKDDGVWEKNYTYHDDDVDEKEILDNFRHGLHPLGAPGAFIEQGAIWQKGLEGNVPDAIRMWKDTGAIKDIFMEEFQKLRK